MNPVLLDLPYPIITPRLILRPPMAGDGKMVNEAIIESFDRLHRWMGWAREEPSIAETEEYARKNHASWILREELILWMFDKETKQFIGGTGFHNIDWSVPIFEIAYWVRTSRAGQGFVSEAVQALTVYAFEAMKARRVEIRCDADNRLSQNVAKRAGYELEATFRAHGLKFTGGIRDTSIFARLSADGLAGTPVRW